MIHDDEHKTKLKYRFDVETIDCWSVKTYSLMMFDNGRRLSLGNSIEVNVNVP